MICDPFHFRNETYFSPTDIKGKIKDIFVPMDIGFIILPHGIVIWPVVRKKYDATLWFTCANKYLLSQKKIS